MRKCFFIFMVLFVSNVYAVDIKFNFSLGEFGMDFNNVNTGPLFNINITRFTWFDVNSGLGLSVVPYNYQRHGDIDKHSILPVEIMYNPLTYSFMDKDPDKPFLAFNWGIYGRGGYGFINNPFEYSSGDGFYGAVGTRLSFTITPIGRTNKKTEPYNISLASIFFEYTTSHTYRLGITADNVFILLVLILGLSAQD